MQQIERVSEGLEKQKFTIGARLLSDFAKSLLAEGLIPETLIEESPDMGEGLGQNTTEETMLSIDSACLLMGVSRATVYKRMKRHSLAPLRKVGDRKSYLKMSDIEILGRPARVDRGGFEQRIRRESMQH